jgi:hypothetical protein
MRSRQPGLGSGTKAMFSTTNGNSSGILSESHQFTQYPIPLPALANAYDYDDDDDDDYLTDPLMKDGEVDVDGVMPVYIDDDEESEREEAA